MNNHPRLKWVGMGGWFEQQGGASPTGKIARKSPRKTLSPTSRKSNDASYNIYTNDEQDRVVERK